MYDLQASQEVFETAPIGMDTSMRSMQHRLTYILEDAGCCVDRSYATTEIRDFRSIL